MPSKSNRVDKFFDLLFELEQDDLAEARSVMEEEGLDPDAEISHSLAMIRRLQGRAELNLAKQRTIDQQERARAIKEKLQQTMDRLPNPLEYLANLMAKRKQGALQVNFRKLGAISNADAIDMIDDVELLSIFEDLDD
jgi:hypothetical protein